MIGGLDDWKHRVVVLPSTTTTASSVGRAPVSSMSRAPTIGVAEGADDGVPELAATRHEAMAACASLGVLGVLIIGVMLLRAA
jgi:hypothetical protein